MKVGDKVRPRKDDNHPLLKNGREFVVQSVRQGYTQQLCTLHGLGGAEFFADRFEVVKGDDLAPFWIAQTKSGNVASAWLDDEGAAIRKAKQFARLAAIRRAGAGQGEVVYVLRTTRAFVGGVVEELKFDE